MFTAFGDSITAGIGASASDKCWLGLSRPRNRGVSGAQAADLSNMARDTQPKAKDCYTIAVGSNDQYKYKNDATKQGYFRQCLLGLVAWLALPRKTLAKNLTKVGAFHATHPLVNDHGLATQTTGGKLVGSVCGPRLYVGYTIQDYYLTLGAASVRVNGQEVGTFSCAGQGMTTHLGATWGAACAVFETGLADHESGLVEIEVTSPTGHYFYCDWVAGGVQDSPLIYLGNVLRWSANSYAINGLSEATTDAYNAIIAQVAAQFSRVLAVNAHAAIDPASHLADGVHPNDAGHAILADTFRASMVH